MGWLAQLHNQSRAWGKWRWLYLILLPWLALAAWGATWRRGRSVAFLASGVIAVFWLSIVASAVSGPPEERASQTEALASAATSAPTTSTSNTSTTFTPRTTTSSSATSSSMTSSTTTLPPGDQTLVERIIDGDTIVVAGGERVRLIGIDTPEVDQDACYAAEATGFIGSIIPTGELVRLVYDVELYDRFDRTLAYVYRLEDGLFVNAEIVAQGYAQILTIPPNVAHAEEFLELQQQAREAGRGLWSACATTTTVPTTTTLAPATTQALSCHPSYEGACVPFGVSDVDCAGGSGDGPNYVGRVRVVGPDVYGLDRDNDGIGCESS